MFRAARRRVLIMDNSKFRRTALHAMMPMADFDLIIVDSNIDEQDLDSLNRTGVQVIVAQVDSSRNDE